MLAEEHAQTALDCLEKADRHFAEDDQIQASEKLWGAAAHAILSVAVERDWPRTSHPAMKRAAEQLSEEHNDPQITDGFAIAEKYHRDFYHLAMTEEAWTADRPKIRELVARVLALRGGGRQNGPQGG